MAKKMRISGMEMDSSDNTCYFVRTDDGWLMDMQAIEERITQYLNEAEESGRYSVAGLCIALDITRDTLGLWRMGYVCADDSLDTEVMPNSALAERIAKAELHIQRHWEESDKSAVQSKYVKMLENTGAFADKQGGGTLSPPFELGSIKKFCK